MSKKGKAPKADSLKDKIKLRLKKISKHKSKLKTLKQKLKKRK